MKQKLKWLWIIPALIFVSTLPYKFSFNGLPYLVEFFDGLTNGFGDYALVGIGIQELIIVAGFTTERFRVYASLGSIVTMIVAIATHFYLGQFDIVFVEAWVVLISSAIVLYREYDKNLNFILDKNE